jgi:hypothetical protein
VAGVAAGRSNNGVAGYCGGCSIIPVKITGSDGYASFSAMASGLTWSADQGARVINLSFAGSSGSTTVRDAIAYAHDRGAVVTVSAGNYGSGAMTYPAAYPGALAVATVDSGEALETYSNYGSWVQVAAPGCNYATKRTTASSPFGAFCGTSSAAPAAAGIAALAFSYKPSATNTEVEQALQSSAVSKSFVQYGRVDAWGTLAALGATNPAATAPTNGGPPMILSSTGGLLTAAPQPGQAVSTSGGGWSGASTIRLTYQWRRCDSAGANCAAIAGATSSTYTTTSADTGYTLRSAVTASNSLGSAVAVSEPSSGTGGTPTGSAPASTSSPAVSGTTTTGSTLSASTGVWSGSPTSYAYQWQRCDSTGNACTALSGATGPSYSLSSGDVNYTMRVAVTASNAYGSSTATSTPTAAVTAAPAAGLTNTSFSGSISKRSPSSSFDVTVAAGDATATLTFTKASSLTVTLIAPDGTTVGTATGASGLRLTRALSAGTYRYAVSGSVAKGSASFTLAVQYTAP